MKRILILSAFFLAALAGVNGAEVAADAGVIAKGEPLPNGLVRSDGELRRVKPLLESLPDGYTLKLEFTTISKVITGYENDVRYVRLATPLNPAGKPDGQEVEFHDWYRKPSRTTEYKNGIRQGLEKIYDVETGTVLSETPWEKGEIRGVKRVFHPNGKLASESTYEKGVVTGQSRSYDENGALIRVVNHVKGKRHGDQVDYWSDKPDAIQRVVPYNNDLVEGVAKGYYLTGQLKWERPFRNNKPHGIEKQYDGQGVLEKTLYWLDGNAVTEEEYKAKERK